MIENSEELRLWIAILIVAFGSGVTWGGLLKQIGTMKKKVDKLEKILTDNGKFVRTEMCDEKTKSVEKSLSQISTDISWLKENFVAYVINRDGSGKKTSGR